MLILIHHTMLRVLKYIVIITKTKIISLFVGMLARYIIWIGLLVMMMHHIYVHYMVKLGHNTDPSF